MIIFFKCLRAVSLVRFRYSCIYLQVYSIVSFKVDHEKIVFTVSLTASNIPFVDWKTFLYFRVINSKKLNVGLEIFPFASLFYGLNLFPNYTFISVTGEYNLRKADGTEQVIPIDQIFIHPNYNPPSTGLDYDVALIKLREPIRFNNNVRPVSLPTRDLPPGTNCYVTGWGNTREFGSIARVNMTYTRFTW